jgi:TDG/mug DNA glycosylase family protein
VLHAAGFTDRQLLPSEQGELLAYGIGITNLVERATAAADELSTPELRDGAGRLEHKVAELAPAVVAFVGLGAYRSAFSRPRAGVGRQQDQLAAATIWLLPNTSGLQARYQLADLVELFGELRASLDVVA